MAFPGILRRLFENDGAGPLLRGDILPLERAAYSVMLTVSGTWTAPYDGFYLVEVQGGGGGGGTLVRTTTCGVMACAGGSGGKYGIGVKYYQKGQAVSCVIGAGGYSGATASQGHGSPGGASAFGTISVQGGDGGRGGMNPDVGYVYFPYVPVLRGGAVAGTQGSLASIAQETGIPAGIYSGMGGASPFGNGGSSVGGGAQTKSGTDGNPGTGYGSGGGGGVGCDTQALGASGMPGCVRVTFIGV